MRFISNWPTSSQGSSTGLVGANTHSATCAESTCARNSSAGVTEAATTLCSALRVHKISTLAIFTLFCGFFLQLYNPAKVQMISSVRLLINLRKQPKNLTLVIDKKKNFIKNNVLQLYNTTASASISTLRGVVRSTSEPSSSL